MEFFSGMRAPGTFTAGKRLERERPNEFGYRDHPIEKGKPAEAAADLPDNIRRQLISVDLRSVDSEQLRGLAGNLLREGYISESAFAMFSIHHLDHPGPVDLTAWIEQSHAMIDSGALSEYPVAIQGYKAGIDAAEGIRDLIAYLNGRLVDEEV